MGGQNQADNNLRFARLEDPPGQMPALRCLL